MCLTLLLIFVLGSTQSCQREGEVVEVTTVQEGGDTISRALELNIEDTILPTTSYLVFRQELALQDMNGFLAIESDSLQRKAERANLKVSGPMTSLFYVWNPSEGYGDAAVALPVPQGTTLSPYVTINLEGGPALAVELTGPYAGLSAYHYALSREIQRRSLEPIAPSIEEYIVGPTQTRDPAQFRTRIIYPYKSSQ